MRWTSRGTLGWLGGCLAGCHCHCIFIFTYILHFTFYILHFTFSFSFSLTFLFPYHCIQSQLNFRFAAQFGECVAIARLCAEREEFMSYAKAIPDTSSDKATTPQPVLWLGPTKPLHRPSPGWALHIIYYDTQLLLSQCLSVSRRSLMPTTLGMHRIHTAASILKNFDLITHLSMLLNEYRTDPSTQYFNC